MFTTRPELARHVRHGRLDALAGVGGRDARRSRPAATRSTRRRRPGFTLQRGRAAPQRARAATPRSSGTGRPTGTRSSSAGRARRRPRRPSTRYRDLGLDLVPGTGHLAAVVPGAFGAWLDLLARYGTLPLADVLGARDRLRARRVPAGPGRVADHRDGRGDVHASTGPRRPRSTCPHGEVPAAGARFTNPALADTFERLLAAAAGTRGGRRSRRRAARSTRGSSRRPSTRSSRRSPCRTRRAERTPGFLRARRPGRLAGDRGADDVACGSRAATVHKTGAWGQGPVLLQQLAMLEALDVAALVRERRRRRTALVHTVVEVAKLAFADREAWYGDVPDVPLETLLSPRYAAARARAGRRRRRPRACCPGSPDGARAAAVAARACGRSHARRRRRGVGEPTVSPIGLSPGDTCHVDVVDRWGNRVSATPSGGWLQSSPVVPGLGFALPTRAQMFWLEPGLPNSLAPGKRPRTTLSPALLLDDDGSGFAFGTPGGDQQDQWTVPFLLRHLLGGAGPAGRDRRARVALVARARLVLPAHAHAARPGRRVPARGRGARRARRARARGGDHRPVGARPAQRGRRRGRTGCSSRPPTRAGMQGYAVGR